MTDEVVYWFIGLLVTTPWPPFLRGNLGRDNLTDLSFLRKNAERKR